MKYIMCCTMLLAIVLNSFETFAQSSLEIHVNNIKSKKGSIQFGLFTTEADLLEKASRKKGY